MKEPMLWKRRLPVDAVVKKPSSKRRAMLFTHYFFDLED